MPEPLTGNILSLDLATVLGWAIGAPGERQPVHGSHTLPSTGKDNGAFICAFEDWFHDLASLHQPAMVVFEAPSLFKFTTPQTVRKLNGLASETERLCHRLNLPCTEANPSRVKKFWTEHGNADKDLMIAQAVDFGFAPKDDNEADAIAIWFYGVDCYGSDAARGVFSEMRAASPAREFKRIRKAAKPAKGKAS